MTSQPSTQTTKGTQTPMRFMIETGSESHTTSWQRCQATYVGGPYDGQMLYQQKQRIISQEWIAHDKHQTVVRTVYELPEETQILINYQSFEGKRCFTLQLDSTQEVQEEEITACRLRSYTIKGRYRLVRDHVQAAKKHLQASQEEDF